MQWFARFYSGNFDVQDPTCSGRLIFDKVDDIMEKIDQDRQGTLVHRFIKIREEVYSGLSERSFLAASKLPQIAALKIGKLFNILKHILL